jgi:hypothetical protein
MIIRQPAYIAQSPLSVTITGSSLPFPPTPIIPAQAFQIGNSLVFNGRGKWASAIDFYGSNATGVTALTFSDLEGVTGNFLSTTASTLNNTINASTLVYVGGNAFSTAVTLSNAPDLSSLQYVGGSLQLNTSASGTVSFPVLVVSGSITGTYNSASAVNFTSLAYLLGSFAPTISGAGPSINLSSLVYCAGPMSFSAANCTTLTLPSLGTWKYLGTAFSSTVNSFSQTTVDNILAALAYMDGTNGTTSFTGTCTITGTSSSPSNSGSTTRAGSSFVGSGTTCTVTWPSHGYSTGDVLRISGITTLTNANKYAVITVQNSGQFTYTITSQTATGGGTATVIKAATSAKTLVTRGVTLTTN